MKTSHSMLLWGVRAMKKRVWHKLIAGALLTLLLIPAAYKGTDVVRIMAVSRSARTLVIDAGHGGFDGGAVGATGTTEQDINLSIAQRVATLSAFFGVQTALTRADDQALDYDASKSVRENKIADIKAREQTVRNIMNPVFLSIHLNKFTDPQYHGAQVFYSPNHAGGRALAELLQQTLVCGADPENHRQAKQAEGSIYLMKKLDCPAVIVECGFLSNPTEEALLAQPDYHKKLAICIVCGYLQYESDG